MKGKNFYKLAGGCSRINLSDMEEEYEAHHNDAGVEEELTAEKVFFSGFNKKLPVEEHSTLLKITKVSLVKNSV